MSATWSEHEHETFGLESLVGKKKASVAYLEVHDGRKALDLIDGNQILERLGVEGGDLVFVLVHCGLFFLITDRLELEQETVTETSFVRERARNQGMTKGSYWLPNSAATKRKPVLRMHMAFDVGTVSK